MGVFSLWLVSNNFKKAECKEKFQIFQEPNSFCLHHPHSDSVNQRAKAKQTIKLSIQNASSKAKIPIILLHILAFCHSSILFQRNEKEVKKSILQRHIAHPVVTPKLYSPTIVVGKVNQARGSQP